MKTRIYAAPAVKDKAQDTRTPEVDIIAKNEIYPAYLG